MWENFKSFHKWFYTIKYRLEGSSDAHFERLNEFVERSSIVKEVDTEEKIQFSCRFNRLVFSMDFLKIDCSLERVGKERCFFLVFLRGDLKVSLYFFGIFTLISILASLTHGNLKHLVAIPFSYFLIIFIGVIRKLVSYLRLYVFKSKIFG